LLSSVYQSNDPLAYTVLTTMTAIVQRPISWTTWSAGTRLSPLWILLELRMKELVVTIGAIRRAMLQSDRHHQQTNTQLFTGRLCRPINNVGIDQYNIIMPPPLGGDIKR